MTGKYLSSTYAVLGTVLSAVVELLAGFFAGNCWCHWHSRMLSDSGPGPTATEESVEARPSLIITINVDTHSFLC